MDFPCDPDCFDLLVCPLARVPLKWVDGALVSTDPETRRRYRVDDGIPILLIDESEIMTERDWRAAMAAEGPVGGGIAALRARQDRV